MGEESVIEPCWKQKYYDINNVLLYEMLNPNVSLLAVNSEMLEYFCENY